MFEKIKAFIKGVFSRLINRTDIQDIFGVEVSMTTDMETAITDWNAAYRALSVYLQDDNVKTLRLPMAICKEVARLVTVEFESEVENSDQLNEAYQDVKTKLREKMQRAVSVGGMVFKPYLDGDKIVVDYVPQGGFLPIKYDSSRNITGIVLPEYRVIGKYIYTRLEWHDLTDGVYTITNRAFVKESAQDSNHLGKEVPLDSVEEWAGLEPEFKISGVDHPLFAVFTMPGDNTIEEGSPLGVSLFWDSMDLIHDADLQYSRIDWEFEGKELAIDVDYTAIRRDEYDNLIYPHNKERLYRMYDFGSNGSETFRPFDPPIRDVSLYHGLDEILRRIEFNCCLAYGTISNPNTVDRTATEIESSKQRSYSMVKDIQGQLQTALEDLVEAMNKWVSINGGPYVPDLKMTFNWDDSIVVDKNTELASMQVDVASGILRPEVYLAKKYGVSEKEALAMMPKGEDVTQTKEAIPEEE